MSSYSVLALCFGVMVGLYLSYQGEKFRKKPRKARELALKGATTGVSALLAAYGCMLHPLPGHFFLLAGLCVCVAADVVLDRNFLAGTAAFGLGHICYCIAYALLRAPGLESLAVFLCLCGAVGALYPQIKKLSGQEGVLPYLCYALLIGAMLALALPQKPVLLLGAALFVLSDGLLLARIVKKLPSRAYDYVCLGCYFLAQFLIAASTLA